MKKMKFAFFTVFLILLFGSATVFAEPAPVTPGDSRGNSTLLATDSESYFTQSVDDRDNVNWFKFTAPETDGYHTVKIKDISSARWWINYEIRTSYDELLSSGEAEVNKEKTILYSCAPQKRYGAILESGATYYIKVWDLEQNKNAKITMSYQPDVNPNDKSQAEVISMNQTYQRSIDINDGSASFEDSDYFKFTTPYTGEYTITVSNINIDAYLNLQFSNYATDEVIKTTAGKNIFANNTSDPGLGKSVTYTTNLVKDTDYYLLIHENDGGNYSFQIAGALPVAKYKVSFNSAGGSSVSAKSVESGKTITAPSNPKKSGYTFLGWYAGKTKYNFSKAVTGNLTLTAKWSKVKVSKTTITKCKNVAGRKVNLSFKKVSDAKGYQIQYQSSQSFSSKKTKTSTKTAYTLKSLKKGTTYYIRVRAYKVDSRNKKVYGAYSNVKKIKITK